ncbi:hypothetical protein VTK73DRAFT_5915 [Phialemonium thermophilum]|uniref:Secreted protein n=1 Tax=Phialemonium thermophilum TaxID=223376 RepID=A0ABR3WLF6_9PEZI
MLSSPLRFPLSPSSLFVVVVLLRSSEWYMPYSNSRGLIQRPAHRPRHIGKQRRFSRCKEKGRRLGPFFFFANCGPQTKGRQGNFDEVNRSKSYTPKAGNLTMGCAMGDRQRIKTRLGTGKQGHVDLPFASHHSSYMIYSVLLSCIWGPQVRNCCLGMVGGNGGMERDDGC